MGNVAIRRAQPEDVPRIWELELGLAEYEKLTHRVTGSAERLAEHLFGPRPIVDCLVAEEDGVIVGIALHYLIYSSFRTQPMMWLEDLFVVPEHRGRGTGKALLDALAREAERLGCWRLSWAVLDWNEPAIGFYESLGAKRDEGGWYVYQLDEARLRAIAKAP
jgi:GNAT superfamily N-acetyltransferase